MATPTWALVGVTIVLVIVTAYYAWQTRKLARSSERATKAAEASARAAEDSVKAMEEQVALQRDQLRYYYEPGLTLQVYSYNSRPDQRALAVKAFPTSQTPVFRVKIAWGDVEGGPADMHLEKGSTWRGDGVRGAWACPRIAFGESADFGLTDRPRGTSLVVTWEYITEWSWRHSWTLTGEVGDPARGLTPNGVPVRIPRGSGSEDPRVA